MAWVPPGVLLAGTAPDKTPRIAEEELPGTPIQLNGFYIDLLAYPNEPGAIATTNVSREDAAHLCEAKGKRLCTEYEWERACKGPDNISKFCAIRTSLAVSPCRFRQTASMMSA